MGKPIRRIKVDLSKFDATWTGSYVIVKTTGFNDQKNFAIDLGRMERKQEKMTRLYKKANKALARMIEEENDEGEEYEAQEAKESELYDESEKASIELIDFMKRAIDERFLEGKIFDEEGLRDMTKEDISDFDYEVLGEISRAIGGQNSKND